MCGKSPHICSHAVENKLEYESISRCALHLKIYVSDISGRTRGTSWGMLSFTSYGGKMESREREAKEGRGIEE